MLEENSAIRVHEVTAGASFCSLESPLAFAADWSPSPSFPAPIFGLVYWEINLSFDVARLGTAAALLPLGRTPAAPVVAGRNAFSFTTGAPLDLSLYPPTLLNNIASLNAVLRSAASDALLGEISLVVQIAQGSLKRQSGPSQMGRNLVRVILNPWAADD